MIELKDICKSYKNKTVLQHLNFTIDKGQRIAIFGEEWQAKSLNGETIAKGRYVKIVKNDSIVMFVEPIS